MVTVCLNRLPLCAFEAKKLALARGKDYIIHFNFLLYTVFQLKISLCGVLLFSTLELPKPLDVRLYRQVNRGLVYADYYFVLVGNLLMDLGVGRGMR